MSQYTVTIKGFESGLTKHAVRQMVQDQFPDAASVEVEPDGT